MKIKPTLEIAKRTIQERVHEFNKAYKNPISKAELAKLQKKQESIFKKEHGQAYIDAFHVYCMFQIILHIANTLKLKKIDNLQLTEEQEDLCAKTLFETWAE